MQEIERRWAAPRPSSRRWPWSARAARWSRWTSLTAAAAAIGITHLVRRSIRLVGSYGGRTRTDMPALIRLIEAGAIAVDAQIGARVPLEDADRAYQALNRGEIVGRALVVP